MLALKLNVNNGLKCLKNVNIFNLKIMKEE